MKYIGKWKIQEMIGNGGNATVFEVLGEDGKAFA